MTRFFVLIFLGVMIAGCDQGSGEDGECLDYCHAEHMECLDEWWPAVGAGTMTGDGAILYYCTCLARLEPPCDARDLMPTVCFPAD